MYVKTQQKEKVSTIISLFSFYYFYYTSRSKCYCKFSKQGQVTQYNVLARLSISE